MLTFFSNEFPVAFPHEILKCVSYNITYHPKEVYAYCDNSTRQTDYIPVCSPAALICANAASAATAWHLYEWYRDNRFCGRCGQKLMHNGTLRMLFCPACGNQVFPKIAPAVIVGVTDGEYILMTTYANREYKRYALIAGFTEIGETAEETVMREVQEEVGLKVKNIHYYKSQPWGFDQNLLLGYFCELDGERDIVLDTGELATAEWVHYSDVPEDPEGLSLTREMMSVFQKNFTSEKMS